MGGCGLGRGRRTACLLLLLPPLLLFAVADAAASGKEKQGVSGKLRFRRESGTFKVVQVADMHYADGRSTACEDVLPSQVAGCTDLNTTAFLYRVFRAEDPDLVVFTGRSHLSDPARPQLICRFSSEPVPVVMDCW
jgi:hypothetical protein